MAGSIHLKTDIHRRSFVTATGALLTLPVLTAFAPIGPPSQSLVISPDEFMIGGWSDDSSRAGVRRDTDALLAAIQHLQRRFDATGSSGTLLLPHAYRHDRPLALTGDGVRVVGGGSRTAALIAYPAAADGWAGYDRAQLTIGSARRGIYSVSIECLQLAVDGAQFPGAALHVIGAQENTILRDLTTTGHRDGIVIEGLGAASHGRAIDAPAHRISLSNLHVALAADSQGDGLTMTGTTGAAVRDTTITAVIRQRSGGRGIVVGDAVRATTFDSIHIEGFEQPIDVRGRDSFANLFRNITVSTPRAFAAQATRRSIVAIRNTNVLPLTIEHLVALDANYQDFVWLANYGVDGLRLPVTAATNQTLAGLSIALVTDGQTNKMIGWHIESDNFRRDDRAVLPH